jgi:hypothetical protein
MYSQLEAEIREEDGRCKVHTHEDAKCDMPKVLEHHI